MSVVDHTILGSVHRFIFQELDEVFFNSDSTQNKTHSAYDMDFPSRRIYPGAPTFNDDGDNQSVNINHTEDSFVVLTVARLVERKGIDDLVDAVADLDDVELWAVGDGPERSALERRVSDDAEDRVTFFGEIDQSSLAQLYRSADAFCLPSVYLRSEGDIEGLGLVLLEAQQFGLPVIGTRSGGIPEAFDDGETGFLVDERSPDQIRDRIATLRDDHELYHSFSERAKIFVQQEFSWENCIQNHLDAYDL
jgi:phosphatidylinositol alpha-1,6-mannosyltransferase